MARQIITSERLELLSYMREGKKFDTDVSVVRKACYCNPVKETELGTYRPCKRRKTVTADLEVINGLTDERLGLPAFLEAGPREKLAFTYPHESGTHLKNVAIVTAGGLAPGVNSVVHSIVERHLKTYPMLMGSEHHVWGVLDSFEGIAERWPHYIELTPSVTETWQDRCGSELGAKRYTKLNLDTLSSKIVDKLKPSEIDILYVVGGDGSLTVAHAVAEKAQQIEGANQMIVVGVPKTMDNDILWVWQSFGFNTAVERAAAFINTMHCEAESTRRIAILQLFGARAGYVAANAALASGHVDLVMIPEEFEGLSKLQAMKAIQTYRDHLSNAIKGAANKPHAVVVIAEGVGEILANLEILMENKSVKAEQFPQQFKDFLKKIRSQAGHEVPAIVVEPQYYVRAVPANAHDQIYCKRLGALAVDNALAGFTDFMISQWLTEYVLVPLKHVADRQKRVPPGGIFWKQVIASTGQPVIWEAD